MTKPLEIEQAIRLIETADKDGTLNKSDYSRIASLPGLIEYTRPTVDGVLVGASTFSQEGKEALPIQKTILLVEDDECVWISTKQMLEKMGHKVIMAADSIKALTLFDQNMDEIDMIVCDMKMRYMTGPELVETLRLKKRVEALFMFNPSQEPIKPGERPRDELLTMPFSPPDLLGKIRTIFEKGNGVEK